MDSRELRDFRGLGFRGSRELRDSREFRGLGFRDSRRVYRV